MSKAIDPSNLETSTDPRTNFYQYANGGWLKKHPIPDEFSRYGTFDVLREENIQIVHSLIEEVASGSTGEDAKDNHMARLVGDFYRTGMNSELIDVQGFDPIKPDLEAIEAIEDRAALAHHIVQLYKRSISTMFFLYASPDRDDATMNIANLHQGGMGLPDVDYYRNSDLRSEQIRKKYVLYIASMMRRIGYSSVEAKRASTTIYSTENILAHSAFTRLEQRDPHKTFNKMNCGELASLSPAFPWETLMEQLGIDKETPINVGQPSFFEAMSRILSEQPLEELKDYLKWRIVNGAANLLSEPFEQAKFSFYGKFLSGKKAMHPRWKRVTTATEDVLGEAIGKLFVERYFPPEAKARMLTLVQQLREVLADRIGSLEWMSESTKVEALEKLSRMRVKIGYPEKWRSFSDLTLSNSSYYENYRAASQFNFEWECSKIGKPVDLDEWHMTPQTVNAYYHPMLNEIVFPAGILQPPFFFKDADDAVNYGAIGVVIGHEMTHGFDDKGRQFDKAGNLNDWWQPEDAERFNARAQVLVEQFNQIKVTDDLWANGELSLGENIADLGGILIAFDALQNALSEKPAEGAIMAEDARDASSSRRPTIDGFTPEQRFFLSYAHIWANNIRKKEMIRLTKEDVHSLGVNRVNGPLPNVEAFLKAFNVGSKDPMFLKKEQRADIW